MSDDHPITIAPAAGRFVVRWRGRTIADTRRALELREHTYPPVFYIPREDADMTLFARSARETMCPYKGVASTFSLREGTATEADAVCTHETPKAGVAAIKDHSALYPNRVQIARQAS
jgi:uncharacterized protein (DUF427 family)